MTIEQELDHWKAAAKLLNDEVLRLKNEIRRGCADPATSVAPAPALALERVSRPPTFEPPRSEPCTTPKAAS